MQLHPVGLIKALHEGLPELLPAHETLGAMTAEYSDDDRFAARKRGDYAFVQGRGDRIHLFLCIDDLTETGALDAFCAADGNWRWLVTWEDNLQGLQAVASSMPLGLVSAARDGTLSRVADAPPQPGIFIKEYPALRKEWRTLASW